MKDDVLRQIANYRPEVLKWEPIIMVTIDCVFSQEEIDVHLAELDSLEVAIKNQKWPTSRVLHLQTYDRVLLLYLWSRSYAAQA